MSVCDDEIEMVGDKQPSALPPGSAGIATPPSPTTPKAPKVRHPNTVWSEIAGKKESISDRCCPD